MTYGTRIMAIGFFMGMVGLMPLTQAATAGKDEDTSVSERRPSSARVRQTDHMADAQIKWDTWMIRLHPAEEAEEAEDADRRPSTATAPEDTQRQVLDEIEAYWASLMKEKLLEQYKAPEAPEEDDDEDAQEDYAVALSDYLEGIETRARAAAQGQMANHLHHEMLKKRGHVRRGSSAHSLASTLSELSFDSLPSTAPSSRRPTTSGDGATSFTFHGLRDALFALAESLGTEQHRRPSSGRRTKDAPEEPESGHTATE